MLIVEFHKSHVFCFMFVVFFHGLLMLLVFNLSIHQYQDLGRIRLHGIIPNN